MRYSDSAEEAAFRGRVRDWLATALPTLPSPPDPHDWPARRRFDAAWQRMQYDAGYAGIEWPTKFGGRDGTPMEQLIFVEECSRAGAPYGIANSVGTKHAGPTIFTEGTDEQKARYLEPILRGDEVWCQGFSEPDSGSDLASLRTRAVQEGDNYIVNGQKIWTSHSQVADLCEMVVRTGDESDRHRALTFLVVPMDSPGIEVRPLRTIMGHDEFAEVFLHDVKVPVANRIGAENDGWRVAMTTLSFERGTAFVGELISAVVLAEQTFELFSGRDDAATQEFRRQLTWISAELDALWVLVVRSVTQSPPGAPPGNEGSIFKLRFTELYQDLTQIAAHALGPLSLSASDLDELPVAHFAAERLRSLSLTLAGGTSQIQRNIIAERMLGLPRG